MRTIINSECLLFSGKLTPITRAGYIQRPYGQYLQPWVCITILVAKDEFSTFSFCIICCFLGNVVFMLSICLSDHKVGVESFTKVLEE